MKTITEKPSALFIERLRDMTERNDHGRAYLEIALWARNHAVIVDNDYRPWFSMFYELLNAIETAHQKAGYLPCEYAELRYSIGRDLKSLIKESFGGETLKAINKRR